jgi:hypothetical protein
MRLAGNKQRPRAKAAGDAGTVDQLHALRAVTFAGTERPELVGSLEATAAMVAVGSSVAAATALVAYPIASGQALRYGLAGALLVAFARGRLPRLTGSQTVRLLALAATGLAGFNAFLIAAVREADAGSVGVIVGCVPVALAVAGPLLERRAVRPRVAAAAVVVSAGAAAVQWAFAYGPGSSSAATTRSWISRGLSWLSFVRPDRHRPKAKGHRSCCYPMHVLERAALQRPGIVSCCLEMLHRPRKYRERLLPLEQLGHAAYMNRREVPGRYEGALAVPGRRDVAVRALEDEEHFAPRNELTRNGIDTRRVPD